MGRATSSQTPETLWDEIATIKRERILGEAVHLFHEKGYLPTTVDAIAERLGATKPFVYYQFKSKVDLLIEICERGTREALEVTVRIAGQQLAPAQKLACFVYEFTDSVLDNQKLVEIYFREQLNLPQEAAERISTMRKKIDHHLRDILKEGQEAGVFVFDNLAISSLVVAGMVSYAFAWYRSSLRLTKEEICEQMVKQVLRSVGADPASVTIGPAPQEAA